MGGKLNPRRGTASGHGGVSVVRLRPPEDPTDTWPVSEETKQDPARMVAHGRGVGPDTDLAAYYFEQHVRGKKKAKKKPRKRRNRHSGRPRVVYEKPS